MPGETVARCACGRTFTADAWKALAFCGYSVEYPTPDEPDELTLEQRHCVCGSTLASETSVAQTLTRHEMRLEALERAS